MSKKKKQLKIKKTSSDLQLAKAAQPRQALNFGGYGVHGDTKYNRRKAKKEARREIARYL